MSNNSGKKRTVIYSNVKENQKKAAEKLESEKINLSDEYIIGLKDLPKIENTKKHKNSTKKIKNKKIKSKEHKRKKRDKQQKLLPSAEMMNQQYLPSTKVKKQKFLPSINTNKKRIPKNKKRINNRLKKKIISLISIFIIITIIIIILTIIFRTPVFNIKELSIEIENNSAMTEENIQNISEIEVGQNMYATKKKTIINNIKRNPYVESVTIKRSFPNKMKIIVKERSVKFQIEEGNQYIYVDNQGYILEKNDVPYDCLVIKGHMTENLNNGEKINKEDLERISDAFKILQEVQNGGIEIPVSAISIENKNDYLIYFGSVGKVAHLGDTSSINDKITYIKKILEIENDYEGEIFVNVNLNNGEYPFFREKV